MRDKEKERAYRRGIYHGIIIPKPKQKLIDSFMDKVMPEPNTGCWFWFSCINRDGYGQFRMNKIKNGSSHRVSYEIHKGKIPTGLRVCHTCDERSCVNPDHLFLGTPSDNSNDMVKKGRQARGSTHVRTTLTDAQVIEIRASNKKAKELAKIYGVRYLVIYDILIGKNWRHLLPKQPCQKD